MTVNIITSKCRLYLKHLQYVNTALRHVPTHVPQKVTLVILGIKYHVLRLALKWPNITIHIPVTN